VAGDRQAVGRRISDDVSFLAMPDVVIDAGHRWR